MTSVSSSLHPVYREDFAALEKRLDLRALDKTRWLITGATGLIPAYLVRFLADLEERHQLGMKLVLWVRSAEKAQRLFPWLEAVPFADLHEQRPWEQPAEGHWPQATHVLHAASPATPRACVADLDGLFNCNVAGTLNLLRGLPRESLRGFLFLSSSEVYGTRAGEAFPMETDPPGALDPDSPRSAYPLAKLAGESICHAYRASEKLPVRIARVFHSYGPGMDLEGDGRIFADLVGNVVRGEALLLKSSGTAKRAFSYLADTVAGLLAILLHADAKPCYNVGHPEGILSMKELAELMHRLSGGASPVELQPGRRQHAESPAGHVFPNVTRLRELGWEPCILPEEGFARTLRAYQT
jgi:dTDP-glucose 4,6-dehydratase